VSIQITHRADGTQIVSPLGLREALRSVGERCYCQTPDADPNEQWDVAGRCPEHGAIWVKASGDPHPDEEES
jgi:hypothetical protein